MRSENLLLQGRIKQLELGIKINKDEDKRASNVGQNLKTPPHTQNRTLNEHTNNGKVGKKLKTQLHEQNRTFNEHNNDRKDERKSKSKPRDQKRDSPEEFEVEEILSHKTTC